MHSDIIERHQGESGFVLVKQNQFAKICWRSVEKGSAQVENFFGFANHFMKSAKSFD